MTQRKKDRSSLIFPAIFVVLFYWQVCATLWKKQTKDIVLDIEEAAEKIFFLKK